MSNYVVIIVTGLIAFPSCKKEQNVTGKPLGSIEVHQGLPGNTDHLSGYLRVSFALPAHSISDTLIPLHADAVFADPPRDLTKPVRFVTGPVSTEFLAGNISVGDVYFSNHKLISETSIELETCRYFNTFEHSYPLRWEVTGNKTFTSFDISLLKGFPAISIPATFDTINLSSDLDDPGIFARNFDSLIVYFDCNSLIIEKRLSSNDALQLSDDEVKRLDTGHLFISLFAKNYFYANWSGKVILLEVESIANISLPSKLK